MNYEYLTVVEHRRRQKEIAQKSELHRELEEQRAAKSNHKRNRRNTLMLTLIEYVVSLGR
jgi:hypothetical protein